ncbi:MAG TPA: cytochrome c [Candidatus Acidoferrum sp.]|nr:cytochrome c [Candidatus Acidoferrum sp.]
MKGFTVGILFAIIVFLGGATYYALQGYVNTQADQEPSFLESKLAMKVMDASADRHAPDAKNPVAATDDNLVAGAKIYAENCAGCHGAPSPTFQSVGNSFYPPAPQFFKDTPDMPENENYYVIQHGVRWTGMPAWKNLLSDQQIWQTVTFLSKIDKLPPAALQALAPAPASPAGAQPEHSPPAH